MRMVDGLLKALPQEEVANVSLAREIGGSVFLACREAPEGSDNPLTSLTPRQYEVLLLAAHRLTYIEIGLELGISWHTALTHLRTGYGKLGVSDKPQASSFIPLDEQKLRSVSLTKQNQRGKPEATLSPAQAIVFKLIGEGHTNKSKASRLEREESTIRSHTMGITKSLGLDAGNNSDVELRRIGGAILALEEYAEVVREVGNDLQPKVVGALGNLEAKEREGEIKLDAGIVHTIHNRVLLRDLAAGGYVQPEAIRYGKLDLPGLVAALLLKHPSNHEVMNGELTQHLAREVIKREVGHYLKQRSSGRVPAKA